MYVDIIKVRSFAFIAKGKFKNCTILFIKMMKSKKSMKIKLTLLFIRAEGIDKHEDSWCCPHSRKTKFAISMGE